MENFLARHAEQLSSNVLRSLIFLCVLQSLSPFTNAAKHGLQSYENKIFEGNSNKLYINKASYSMKTTQSDSSPDTVSSDPEPSGKFGISLYPWNDHLGRELKMEWSALESENKVCKQVASRYIGKVRSINSYDQCVVLFSREGCSGPYRVINKSSPSHNRLSDICFHRRTTSVRPCKPGEDY